MNACTALCTPYGAVLGLCVYALRSIIGELTTPGRLGAACGWDCGAATAGPPVFPLAHVTDLWKVCGRLWL